MEDSPLDHPGLPDLDRANIYFAVEHGFLDPDTATLMLLRLSRERQQAKADRAALDLLTFPDN